MARSSFPPGFRFHPTDVELVVFYLKRKIMGKKLNFDAIAEINLYQFSPWDLPEKSCLKSKDLEWFFFCPREKKYASGARTNRATETGYWKATGKDRPVTYKEKTVGMVKTLVFHLGHPPRGERTDWVMHEYRIVDMDLADAGFVQDAYVLCKVFQKSGPGPKNGAQYGAPFNEEEWDNDADSCAESSTVGGLNPAMARLTHSPNTTAVVSMIVPGSTCGFSFTEPGSSTARASANDELANMPDNDDIALLLAMFSEETSPSTGNENSEELAIINGDEVIEAVPSEEHDIYNGLEYLGNLADLNDGGFNISSIQEAGLDPVVWSDDTAYLELSDLETPLTFTAVATDFEQLPSDTFSAHYNIHGFLGTHQHPSVSKSSAHHNFENLQENSAKNNAS